MAFNKLAQACLSALVLAALLLSSFVLADSCSAINECSLCDSTSGCGWCALTNSCVAGSAYGPTNSNSQCANGKCWSFTNSICPVNCTSLDTCSTCTQRNGCAWCGYTNKCTYAQNSNSSPCGESCSTCFKIYGTSTTCPKVSSCETLTDCKSCTDNQCYWCGKNKICMEASSTNNPTPCGFNDESCGYSSTADCWKGSSAECPKVSSCEAITDCMNCTSNNCYWCGAKKQCMEATSSNNPTPCGFNGESCGYSSTADCWKGSPTLCPKVSSCEALTDCMNCTSNNCYWCGKNKKCMEASTASSPTPCGFNGESCGYSSTADCWKGSPTQCPKVSTCEAISDCFNCTTQGCAWCGAKSQCMEASTARNPTPCDGSCGYSAAGDCWKLSAQQCPTVNCSLYNGDCRACTNNPHCGYCSDNKKCMEISSASNPTACTGSCDVLNVGNCDAQCGTHAQNCTSCLQDEVGCGLCSGYSLGGNSLYTKCVAANEDRSSPDSSYSCTLWHNTTCPTCDEAATCNECRVKANCGWCKVNNKIYGASFCTEGNARHTYDADRCVIQEFSWDFSCGGEPSCPSYNGILCGGNGQCNITSLFCTCNNGYSGPACSCTTLGKNPTCVHGTCDAKGNCNCQPNFFGESCSVYCDANTCGKHGSCATDGTCNCDANYYGDSCQTFCTAKDTCSGKGGCDSNGGCNCLEGWTGSDCSVRDCATLSTCNDCNSGCKWCETSNACMANGDTTPCDQVLSGSQCSASCTSLSANQCTDGSHCNCASCDNACFFTPDHGNTIPSQECGASNWICTTHGGGGGSPLSGGAIAGIVIGVLVVVFIAIGAFVVYQRRFRYANL